MITLKARLTGLLYDKGVWSRRLDPWSGPDPGAVAIRRLEPDVRTPHERLAALDSAPVLEGDVLVAYVDDEPWAAISLLDGRVVADPFRPSAHAVELLEIRARHLRDAARARPAAGRSLRTQRAAG